MCCKDEFKPGDWVVPEGSTVWIGRGGYSDRGRATFAGMGARRGSSSMKVVFAYLDDDNHQPVWTGGVKAAPSICSECGQEKP